MNQDRSIVFQIVGGSVFFKKLINLFYDKIEQDYILRPVFPKKAFTEEGRRNQILFMQFIFGGPKTYLKIRGSPQLRKRHLPFKIGLKERNQWIHLMYESLEELNISSTHQARPIMNEYFEKMATKLINEKISATDISPQLASDKENIELI